MGTSPPTLGTITLKDLPPSIAITTKLTDGINTYEVKRVDSTTKTLHLDNVTGINANDTLYVVV